MRWSVSTERIPFFSEVDGLHNWVFYAYLESHGKVFYDGYEAGHRPRVLNEGNKVSYILREGDPRKCHIGFFRHY